MKGNPVGWFEIYVKDMQRAKAFYESMLAVKLDKLESPDKTIEMWAFPMQQDGVGAAGSLAKMQGGPSGGGTSTIVYFSCDDCAVEAKRVPKGGGKIMKDKFSIGQHGFIALLTDTEDNVIGLHSLR